MQLAGVGGSGGGVEASRRNKDVGVISLSRDIRVNRAPDDDPPPTYLDRKRRSARLTLPLPRISGIFRPTSPPPVGVREPGWREARTVRPSRKACRVEVSAARTFRSGGGGGGGADFPVGHRRSRDPASKQYRVNTLTSLVSLGWKRAVTYKTLHCSVRLPLDGIVFAPVF
jgi:hypothetical protein